jgi:DNA adenine methylase
MSRYKTPLRYPGGKQKLAPFIIEIIRENSLDGGHYVEPYAGGAGVAIELLLNGTVGHIHLNDSCVGVYAFWKSVLSKPEELCRRISSASMSIDEWRRQKEIFSRPSEFDQIDVGFSVFYLNRCNRSGILSGGVIGGLKQEGEWKMDARFPRNELIGRIEAIASRKSAITLRNWDAEKFILKYVPRLPAGTLIYCDPPYFRKADRLYLNHYDPDDHARIAQVMQREVKHHWVVSYDGAPEILKHYSKRRSFSYSLQYNAAKAYKGTEVFFFSDGLWLPKESVVAYIDCALKKIDRRERATFFLER